MSNCRLFMVPVSEIFDHPPHLPEDITKMPIGPIEGWEAYVTRFGTHEVFCMKNPVIKREGSVVLIEMKVADGVRSYTQNHFFSFRDFQNNKGPEWYQSGLRLKFIKSREKEEEKWLPQ